MHSYDLQVFETKSPITAVSVLAGPYILHFKTFDPELLIPSALKQSALDMTMFSQLLPITVNWDVLYTREVPCANR